MARLPAIKRLTKEDFPTFAKTVGGEVDRFFLAVNGFMDTVTNAMNGGLSVADNLLAEVKTLTMEGSFTISFKTTLKPLVVGVFVVRAVEIPSPGHIPAALEASVWADWTQSGDLVNINHLTGLVAGHKYRVTFVVLGGTNAVL